MTTVQNENPTDSNLVAHAIRELDLIGETSYETPSMRECVLDMVRLMSEQGHSGSSAAWLVGILEKLMRFQPLTPLTDASEDWIEVGDDLWQCRRDSECFSSDGGQTYARLGDDTVHTAVSHG